MNKNDGSLIGMEMHRHSTENDSSWLSHDTWCSELLFDGSPNGELFVLQTFFFDKNSNANGGRVYSHNKASILTFMLVFIPGTRVNSVQILTLTAEPHPRPTPAPVATPALWPAHR